MKKIIIALMFIFVLYSCMNSDTKPSKADGVTSKKTQEKKNTQAEERKNIQPEDEIESAQVEKIPTSGELADLFNIGSDGTELQRDEALKKIKGKIVQWKLTVYEIKLITDDKYLLTTGGNVDVVSSNGKFKIANKEPSVAAKIIAKGVAGKNKMLKFKTGDFICIKGKLTGESTFRALEINPAILCEI
jgi:hypothetical protein